MLTKKLFATIFVSTLTTYATTSEAACNSPAAATLNSKLQLLFFPLSKKNTNDECSRIVKTDRERYQLDESYQSGSLSDNQFREASYSFSSTRDESLSSNKNPPSKFKMLSPEQTQENLIPSLKGYTTVSD